MTKIDTLWESFLDMPTYDSITNQMLIMEAYETAMGIYPDTDRSPITLVTMNASTDFMHNTMLERTIDRIIQLKLHTITGMSLMEILDLPTYVLQMLLRSVTKAGIIENRKLAAIEANLKAEQQNILK